MNKFNHAYYNKILKEADSKNGRIYDVNLHNCYLKELPEFFKDLTIDGILDVERNLLTSCKNFPKVVDDIYMGNNQIITLDGIQNLPTKGLTMDVNKIISLEALSQFNGTIRTIFGGSNPTTSFKGLENLTCDIVIFPRCKISSFKYLPKKVRKLRLLGNNLTSWEGMPSGLEVINVSENWDVSNMDGFKQTDSVYFSSSTLNIYTTATLVSKLGVAVPPYIYVHKL
jgi:hypothetical protein